MRINRQIVGREAQRWGYTLVRLTGEPGVAWGLERGGVVVKRYGTLRQCDRALYSGYGKGVWT